MKDTQKNEYVLTIKTYDEEGIFKSLETYILLPLEGGRSYWLHSSLCGESSQKLRALADFLLQEEICDEVDELVLGNFILVDKLHGHPSEYTGVPCVGHAYYVH